MHDSNTQRTSTPWVTLLIQVSMAIKGECLMLIHGEKQRPGPFSLAKSAWISEDNVCSMHMYLNYLSVLDQVSMIKDKDYTWSILLSQVSMDIGEECTILLSQISMAIGGKCLPFSLAKSTWLSEENFSLVPPFGEATTP
jgi:hypothetical protein